MLASSASQLLGHPKAGEQSGIEEGVDAPDPLLPAIEQEHRVGSERLAAPELV